MFFWFYSAYCLFISCQFFGARVNVRCGLSKHKIIGNLDYIFRLSTYSGISKSMGSKFFWISAFHKADLAFCTDPEKSLGAVQQRKLSLRGFWPDPSLLPKCVCLLGKVGIILYKCFRQIRKWCLWVKCSFHFQALWCSQQPLHWLQRVHFGLEYNKN